MDGLWVALRFLTRLPLPPRDLAEEAWGRAAVWYPVVGLLIGGVLAGVHGLASSRWEGLPVAVMPLVVWVLLTGGLHLDGWMDTWDALGGGYTPEERWRILKDPRVGAFGVAAAVLLLLWKVAFLTSLPPSTAAKALLLAPVWGRWMPVFVAHYVRPARAEGWGARFLRSVRPPHIFLATLLTLGLTWLAAGEPGFWVLLGVWACGLLGAFAWQRAFGGFSGDLLGALIEGSEGWGLFWSALLWR
jgi:adenosylcobinamide-GDP ribazoletransferase